MYLKGTTAEPGLRGLNISALFSCTGQRCCYRYLQEEAFGPHRLRSRYST